MSDSIFDLEFVDINKVMNNKYFIAGSDEVGRGPIAGPVVAATVFMKINKGSKIDNISGVLQNYSRLGVTDSKKLTERKRKKILSGLGIKIEDIGPFELFGLLKNEKVEIVFLISEVSARLIDRINILNASLSAIKDSFEICYQNFQGDCEGVFFVDGTMIPSSLPKKVDARSIVRGDSKSILIGLASIIAKEYRDGLMKKMHKIYPGYGFDKHVGYPTIQHKNAVKSLGISPIHRKTFKGVKEFCERR